MTERIAKQQCITNFSHSLPPKRTTHDKGQFETTTPLPQAATEEDEEEVEEHTESHKAG